MSEPTPAQRFLSAHLARGKQLPLFGGPQQVAATPDGGQPPVAPTPEASPATPPQVAATSSAGRHTDALPEPKRGTSTRFGVTLRDIATSISRNTSDSVAPVPVPRVDAPCLLMRQMQLDLAAEAAQLSEAITAGLTLGRGARRLHKLLLHTALGSARARELPRLPDVVEFHLPMELIGLAEGVERTTVHRWAAKLASLGLATREPHRSFQDGLSRADGVVWAVRMAAPRPTSERLTVSGHAISYIYRDVMQDRRRGNTVWALQKEGLQQSVKRLKASDGREVACRWGVSPGFAEKSPLDGTVAAEDAAGLERVWDASVLGLQDRRTRTASLDRTARALAARLGDLGSVNLYRWMLWQLCRLYDDGADLWQAVLLQVEIVYQECREGAVCLGGALLVHRLKRSGLWTHLREVGQRRVGVRPSLVSA